MGDTASPGATETTALATGKCAWALRSGHQAVTLTGHRAPVLPARLSRPPQELLIGAKGTTGLFLDNVLGFRTPPPSGGRRSRSEAGET